MDTGLDFLKTTSKKVVHKTGEILGNKISDAVTKSNINKIVKTVTGINESSRNLEELIIPPEKRKEILNELRQAL